MNNYEKDRKLENIAKLLQTQNKLTEEIISQVVIDTNKKIKENNKKVNKLKTENEKNKKIIEKLKIKTNYADMILKNKNTITVTAIAKDYGMSASELNKLLNNLKIQYKQSGQWFLYSKYQKCGYTHSKTVAYIKKDGTMITRSNTEWTQKGRLFLYNKLKKEGIVPLIEKQINN